MCAFSSPGLYCPESPTPMKELRIDQNIAIVAITNIVNVSPDINPLDTGGTFGNFWAYFA